MGNSLAILVMEARRRCYRNPQTGEVRNWFYSTIGDLAKSAGFSSKKVLRLLKLPLAAKFIRYKPTYIYNPELGKKVHGKCLFKVSLDDPLIPEDKIQTIREEIHKPLIFESTPKPSIDCQAVSLEIPPPGQLARNRYITSQEINKDINNTTVTNGLQGEIVLMDHGIPIKPKELKTPQGPTPMCPAIIQELGANSVLLRTILRSCTIVETPVETGMAIISIGAPNSYYMRVLEIRLRKNLTRILERETGQKIILNIAHSDQGH